MQLSNETLKILYNILKNNFNFKILEKQKKQSSLGGGAPQQQEQSIGTEAWKREKYDIIYYKIIFSFKVWNNQLRISNTFYVLTLLLTNEHVMVSN